MNKKHDHTGTKARKEIDEKNSREVKKRKLVEA